MIYKYSDALFIPTIKYKNISRTDPSIRVQSVQCKLQHEK